MRSRLWLLLSGSVGFGVAFAGCNQLPTEVIDVDAGSHPVDSGVDAGRDAGLDAGDAGHNAGVDAGEVGLSDGGDAGFTGVPIQIPTDAPYDTWTWIPIPGTYCANGSPTGLGINPHQGATKLQVFLAGGGMCFDYLTCFVAKTASNLDGFSQTELNADISELDNQPGGLNRADATNPFKDWNYVVLPYCTGDIFAGTQQQTYADPLGGLHTMDHVGHWNIGAYLQILVPTFYSTTTQLVLSGSSAGGYGALLSYPWVQDAFKPIPTVLIDDSGPPMRAPYLATSLLETLWSAWGMQAAIPPGCTTCTPQNGMSTIIPYLTTDPHFRGALLSSEQDEVIKDFLTIGNPLMQVGAYFQLGLNNLYTSTIQGAGPGKFEVFFIQSSQHVWFVFNNLGQVTSQGVTLEQFLEEEITPDGGPWTSVVPPSL